MIRLQCSQCGKIIEFLRKFQQGTKGQKCTCGGNLHPVNKPSEIKDKKKDPKRMQ